MKHFLLCLALASASVCWAEDSTGSGQNGIPTDDWKEWKVYFLNQAGFENPYCCAWWLWEEGNQDVSCLGDSFSQPMEREDGLWSISFRGPEENLRAQFRDGPFEGKGAPTSEQYYRFRTSTILNYAEHNGHLFNSNATGLGSTPDYKGEIYEMAQWHLTCTNDLNWTNIVANATYQIGEGDGITVTPVENVALSANDEGKYEMAFNAPVGVELHLRLSNGEGSFVDHQFQDTVASFNLSGNETPMSEGMKAWTVYFLNQAGFQDPQCSAWYVDHENSNAVVGCMEGAFSKPMESADGLWVANFIAPADDILLQFSDGVCQDAEQAQNNAYFYFNESNGLLNYTDHNGHLFNTNGPLEGKSLEAKGDIDALRQWHLVCEKDLNWDNLIANVTYQWGCGDGITVNPVTNCTLHANADGTFDIVFLAPETANLQVSLFDGQYSTVAISLQNPDASFKLSDGEITVDDGLVDWKLYFLNQVDYENPYCCAWTYDENDNVVYCYGETFSQPMTKEYGLWTTTFHAAAEDIRLQFREGSCQDEKNIESSKYFTFKASNMLNHAEHNGCLFNTNALIAGSSVEAKGEIDNTLTEWHLTCINDLDWETLIVDATYRWGINDDMTIRAIENLTLETNDNGNFDIVFVAPRLADVTLAINDGNQQTRNFLAQEPVSTFNLSDESAPTKETWTMRSYNTSPWNSYVGIQATYQNRSGKTIILPIGGEPMFKYAKATEMEPHQFSFEFETRFSPVITIYKLTEDGESLETENPESHIVQNPADGLVFDHEGRDINADYVDWKCYYLNETGWQEPEFAAYRAAADNPKTATAYLPTFPRKTIPSVTPESEYGLCASTFRAPATLNEGECLVFSVRGEDGAASLKIPVTPEYNNGLFCSKAYEYESQVQEAQMVEWALGYCSDDDVTLELSYDWGVDDAKTTVYPLGQGEISLPKTNNLTQVHFLAPVEAPMKFVVHDGDEVKTYEDAENGYNYGDSVVAIASPNSGSKATPRYYNLQGQRLDAPLKGEPYIEINGSQARKVILQ